MIQRFEGQEGRSALIDALRGQSALLGDVGLVQAVCDKAEILGFEPGESIIEEAAATNDVYFILSGIVSIKVNGREVAVRTSGQHVGEMAALDPGQRRSASAVAEDGVVVAHLDAVTLNSIAESFPQLWRNIARQLAERLRQRNRYVFSVNPRPVLFVGCSTESLEIAREIQTALHHDPIVVKLWTDGIFDAGRFPLESLERELEKVDFAVLVLSPDDTVISRDSASDAPRDNIVFELGFFMGSLNRSRTFLLVPWGLDLKLPTDLAGITPLTYEPDPRPSGTAAVAVASNELRKRILETGPR